MNTNTAFADALQVRDALQAKYLTQEPEQIYQKMIDESRRKAVRAISAGGGVKLSQGRYNSRSDMDEKRQNIEAYKLRKESSGRYSGSENRN